MDTKSVKVLGKKSSNECTFLTFSVHCDFAILVTNNKSAMYIRVPAVGDDIGGVAIVLPEGIWLTVVGIIPQLQRSLLSAE